jgi:hypothetical protein
MVFDLNTNNYQKKLKALLASIVKIGSFLAKKKALKQGLKKKFIFNSWSEVHTIHLLNEHV